jgi:hypothetical protein
MNITFPQNTEITIDAIRSAIGRDVTFYTEERVPCSACGIDTVTDTSTNPFCNVCSGRGYVITLSGTDVLAHITHGPLEVLGWETGGQLREGEVRLQVKYTVVNWNLVTLSKYVTVDDVNYTIRNKIKRGVPQLNRIILNCTEES